MNLQDRLASDPLGAACGCIVWIPISVWIVSAIHWMVSADLEVLFGVLSIAIAAGLGILTVNPPVQGMSPWLCASTTASIVFFPAVRSSMNRRALGAIDVQQLERFYGALLKRPDNAGALIRLAELLYIRGFPANAIGLGEKALQSLPVNLFAAEHQMVQAWKQQVRGRSLPTSTPCLNCGYENKLDDLHCQGCGTPYIVDLAKGKWLARGSAKKLIAVWIGLVIAFVGIPTSVELAKTSSTLALVAIGLQVLVAVAVIFLGFSRVKR